MRMIFFFILFFLSRYDATLLSTNVWSIVVSNLNPIDDKKFEMLEKNLPKISPYPLCYPPFENGKNFKTPCGHEFHQDCIVEYDWSACPYCRQNLSTAEFSRFYWLVVKTNKMRAILENENLSLDEKLKNVLDIYVWDEIVDMEVLRAKVVTRLILQGAERDAAIDFAVTGRNAEIMKQLVDAGVDFNVKGDFDLRPLLARKLKETIQCYSAYLLRSCYDDFGDAQFLFKIGVQLNDEALMTINKKDYAGRTPLMYAVNRNDLFEIVQLLVKAGADLDATYDYDYTAFDLAETVELRKLTFSKRMKVKKRLCLLALPIAFLGLHTSDYRRNPVLLVSFAVIVWYLLLTFLSLIMFPIHKYINAFGLTLFGTIYIAVVLHSQNYYQ